MSKRGLVDLATDERADSPQPVRRSSRISSGQNLTSSPAPKAIRTRRSSANAEKTTVETNNITTDVRKTRRTSTDEDPKPAPIRTRRSSVSKVIEEEKTSTPNSPSRRNTRLSSSSPSLDVPARRTRRSSQDSETVEIPARRSTRRSSTGLQEPIVEEVIEKAKPITRRRRSSSIDEQEEDTKVETRPKTKRLFNEDNQLEPIKELEQEVKEKEATEEKQEVIHTLEVIEELADDESERILDSLNEVLGEESSYERNGADSEKSNTEEKDKTKTETNHKEEKSSVAETILEQAASVDEKEETENKEFPEEKSSSEKCLPEESITDGNKDEVDEDKLQVEAPKETDLKSPANEAQSVTKESEAEKLEDVTTENSDTPISPEESPVVQLKNYIEIGEDGSYTLSLKEDNEIEFEKTENKTATFCSPGSDKENSSMNIPKKRRSIKLNEGILNNETEKLAFAAKKTPRNSLCEPMDVDEDEDDLFKNEAPSTIVTPKDVTMNGHHTEVIEEKESEVTVQNVSLKDADISKNVFDQNTSIKNTSLAMEGSFSQLNSSPDKGSPSVKKTESHVEPQSNENKTSTADIINETDDDCASETSIKLVDTDEEEEAAKKALYENEEKDESLSKETSQLPTEDVTVSGLDESVLDKSFDSDKNQSILEKSTDKLLTVTPTNEEDDTSTTVVDSEDEIIEVVDSNDIILVAAKSSHQNEDAQEESSAKRKSIDASKTILEVEVEAPSTEEKDPTNIESNVEFKELEESKELEEPNNSILQTNEEWHSVPENHEDNEKVLEIVPSTPKSKDSRKSIEKSEELEKSVLESNDSKANISLVKMENDSDLSENVAQEIVTNVAVDLVKQENNIVKNSPRKSMNKLTDSNNSEKNLEETCLETSVGQESEEKDISKSVMSPSTIILKSVTVIKQSGDEVQEIDQSKSSEQEIGKGDNTSKNQEQESSTVKSRTRHSLPNSEKKKTETEKKENELEIKSTKTRLSFLDAENKQNETEKMENEEVKIKNTRSRLSLPDAKNKKSDTEKRDNEELKNKNTKSRHSLPNKIRHERENISKLSLQKPTSSSTESMNEGDEENLRLLDKDTEVHLISSSDDENNTLEIADGSALKKIKEEKCENPKQKVEEPSAGRKSLKRINPYSEVGATKRKSEETGGISKKLKVSSEKTTEERDQDTERKPSKDKRRRSKRQIEIMTRSGIDIEDDEESSDEIELNEYFDEMAEEGEESLGEEENDEYEIKDEGESVLSSGTEEESSEDDYDPNDSFIDDEEQELISGEEEYLGLVKTKKKYKKIIAPSTSDSDEVFEPVEMSSKIPEADFVPIHKKPEEEDTGKSFEEKIDSILKVNPEDKDMPSNTITDVMNSSAVSESSVILQETCSIGAAKSKVILDRIHGMVDVFCKNINESEGNISLNVSLNFKPPQNSPSMEKIKSRDSLNISLETAKDDDKIVENSSNESKRLSNDKSHHTYNRKSLEKIDVSIGKDQSKNMELEEVHVELKKHQDDSASKDETRNIESEDQVKVKKSRRNRKKSKNSSIEKNVILNEESKGSELKKKKPEPSSNTSQDNKSDEIESSQTKTMKKTKKESKQEKIHDNSDQKEKKKKTTKNVSDSKEKDSSEQKSGKKKLKHGESTEKIASQTHKKHNEQSEATIQMKEKKVKRKNLESMDKEVPSKKVCTSKSKLPDSIKTQIEAKNLKEIKPSKSSKRLKDSEKTGSKKQKIELKASSSNEVSEWEEEVAVVQPSAANTSISGFNLEKIISRDFKNRMIYDSSRNKREPSVKSRRQHKK
ncbi:myb-like protein X [Coccinella septempunctata]|uniref:myb-like protein X n=1 Tax=Coccinella septempunctata TaxID=41139 RepID=UPI001D078077|nr:myb-like protein X [Coccinella septempunctata]